MRRPDILCEPSVRPQNSFALKTRHLELTPQPRPRSADDPERIGPGTWRGRIADLARHRAPLPAAAPAHGPPPGWSAAAVARRGTARGARWIAARPGRRIRPRLGLAHAHARQLGPLRHAGAPHACSCGRAEARVDAGCWLAGSHPPGLWTNFRLEARQGRHRHVRIVALALARHRVSATPQVGWWAGLGAQNDGDVENDIIVD